MTSYILEIKTTNLQEFYINKECFGETAYKSVVEFTFDIRNSENNNRHFTVNTFYIVTNGTDQVMTRLETKSEFELKGISMDQDSFKVLEQCAYIAYSEMLKQHKQKYKTWAALYEDIALPEEEHVNAELNKILLSLLY